ncbi:MAG: cation diffusion facilitator family transporter [Solirubrobacterales bacterium]
MSHAHAHRGLEARRSGNRSRMLWALAINVALLAATIAGGILTGSLALLADAGHLLSDVGAIAIGLLAARLAGAAPTPSRTFGLQRSEVIAALVNGLVLVAVAVLVTVEAIDRMSDPPHVAGAGVLAIGAVGLVGNVAATWVLARGERSDINLEAVLRHSAADALGSIGVIVAGAVILASGWDLIDPIVSILIAVLIALGSWRLLKEPFDVLMEAAPPGLDARAIGEAMVADADVVEVHDLHVWTVTSGFPALSAHVVVRSGANRDVARARLEQLLTGRFEIDHTTLQMAEPVERDQLIQVEWTDSDRPRSEGSG